VGTPFRTTIRGVATTSHDKKTSESYYMERLRFIIQESADVDSVRLHLKFVAGGIFKISGVAFCSI
jgi:hypothetical protein